MINRTTCDLAVVGGGPAGFFAALHYAELCPEAEVIILEKTDRVLQKVLISGGGRCNITHDCNDPHELIQYYPRGGKSLLSAFYGFKPEDTLNWFRTRGLNFYTDEIGCVFPETNKSQSVIDMLLKETARMGVRVWRDAGVETIEVTEEGTFELRLPNGNRLSAAQVLVATGGNRQAMKMLRQLDVPIIEPVPSLFPLKTNATWMTEFAGLAVENCSVSIQGTKFTGVGTVLITHRGISGPGVIRLSSWAARYLKEKEYRVTAQIDWLFTYGTLEQTLQTLKALKTDQASKSVIQHPVFPVFASRLWRGLCSQVSGLTEKRWADVSNAEFNQLNDILRRQAIEVVGRDQHKQEYVTCGGVDRKSINLRTLESKTIPDLYFAGEVMDIDGLTGGYNLQNCWTTGWLAGTSLAEKVV